MGFIAASASDVISTRRALDAGATEQNPLIGGSPDNTKLVGLKVAGWFALRGLENVLADEVGRPLRWWEKVLFWAVPTGLAVWASHHNHAVAREYELGLR